MNDLSALRQVRHALRAGLPDIEAGQRLLVALSGGPDSLALAAAAAAEAQATAWSVGAVVVDHQLQPQSAAIAQQAATTARELGLDPVVIATVWVAPGQGPEAGARQARYAALRDQAVEQGAVAVLLGHTLDDQAETVLLGLARGSGSRSLSGMAGVSGLWRRPLLSLRRDVTVAACEEIGLTAWLDPHNASRQFARARVRHDVLPALVAALGDEVPVALARTARLLRADDQALSGWALRIAAEVEATTEDGIELDIARLVLEPAAVRTRVLRQAALDAGVPGGALTSGHIDTLDAFLTGWHGQGKASLPGEVLATRDCGRLRLIRKDGPAGKDGPAPTAPTTPTTP